MNRIEGGITSFGDQRIQRAVEQEQDLHTERIRSLRAAQASFAEVTRGRSIAVIDMTAAGFANILEPGLKFLQDQGGPARLYAQFILEQVLGGSLPKNAGDVFKLFLGNGPTTIHTIPVNQFHRIRS